MHTQNPIAQSLEASVHFWDPTPLLLPLHPDYINLASCSLCRTPHWPSLPQTFPSFALFAESHWKLKDNLAMIPLSCHTRPWWQQSQLLVQDEVTCQTSSQPITAYKPDKTAMWTRALTLAQVQLDLTSQARVMSVFNSLNLFLSSWIWNRIIYLDKLMRKGLFRVFPRHLMTSCGGGVRDRRLFLKIRQTLGKNYE